MKNRVITVQGSTVSVSTRNEQDYISLTDMLKAKDGDFFLSDWLRNRNTVEFLGVWESIYNPAFNYGEFAIIKSQAGLNSYKLSAKEWAGRTGAPGNMRDSATLEQLVVLSNLESINAMLIHQGLQQSDRLIQLNAMAITQMRSLVGLGSIKQLKSSQGSK